MRHGLPCWAIAAVVIGACSSGGGGNGGSSPPAVTLVAITVAPQDPTTIVGGTVAFHATGVYDDNSTREVTDSVTWGSNLTGTATVSNTAGTRGVATGGAGGSATITAAIGTVHGETTLTVVAATVTAIRIDPAVPAVALGRTIALRCLGATGGGPEVDLTGLANWSSDAPDVASVSGGEVTGAKTGTALITATYGAFTATATVTVSVQPPALVGLELSLPASAQLAVGAAGQAQAVAVYDDGSRIAVTPLASFTSSAPGVLAFGHMAGEYRALATGPATVTAAWSGKSATAAVQVVPNAISALVVDPAPPLLPAGDALPLHATVLRLDGSSADVTGDAIWTTDAPQAVTVDPSGVASACGRGSAVVRAAYGGMSAATILEVTDSTATQLALYRTSEALVVGATSTFGGTLWFADGTSEPATDVARFAIADGAIVSMGRWSDGTLYYRGLAPGTTSVTVSAGGLTQTVTVQVSAPTWLTLDVPAATVVGTERPIGATANASATVSDMAQWSSDAPAIAEVTWDVRGYPRLVAHATGTAHVTASLAGATAAATVTVVDPPTWLEVTPASFGIPIWTSQALTVTGHLASGAAVDLTRVADWIMDNPKVGSIYQGLFQSSSAAGSATLTAAVAGVTGRADVLVWPDQPSTIAIAPPLASGASGPYTLSPGAVVGFSVSAQYLYYVPTRPPLAVAWTSADPAVAAFSSDPAKRGELTAVAPGTTTVTATYDLPTGGTRTATATVSVAPLVSLAASPASVGVMPSESKAVAVTGTFDPGVAGTFTADVTPWAAWTSSAPEVAQPAGVMKTTFITPGVLGVSPGAAVLTASFGGASVEVPVVGLPPSVSSVRIGYHSPGSVGLTFSPTASAVLVPNGRSVDVTSLATWSTDGAVLGVLGTPPVVSLLAAGSGWLRAAFGGQTTTSSMSVVSYPYYALVPDVRRFTLAPGSMDSFQVREYRQNYLGDTVGEYSTVASSNPAVATAWPTTNGVYVQAHAPGEATVTASFGGVDARVAVNVFDMAGDLWLWDDGTKVLHVHERTAFSVTDSISALRLYFSTGSGLTWTSSDPSVVAVVGPGSVQALKPGRAVVTVSSAAWKASIPLTVSSATLVEIASSTPAVPLPVGAVQPLRAYARFSDGASVDVTSDVEWWSATPAAAAFDGAPGAVHALAAGTTRVEARLDGLAGYAIVTGF